MAPVQCAAYRERRERVAGMTPAQRAADQERHATLERERVAGMTPAQRAAYQERHATLERERVAGMPAIESATARALRSAQEH